MLRETRTGEELAWGRGGTLVVPDGTVGESAVDFRLSVGGGGANPGLDHGR